MIKQEKDLNALFKMKKILKIIQYIYCSEYMVPLPNYLISIRQNQLKSVSVHFLKYGSPCKIPFLRANPSGSQICVVTFPSNF